MKSLISVLMTTVFLISCTTDTKKENTLKPGLCQNWDQRFENLQNEMKQNRQQISEWLDSKSAPALNTQRKRPARNPKSRVKNFRVEHSEVPPSEPLSKYLPKFSYIVIPPKIHSAQKMTPKTLFILPGGPGNILSDALSKAQQDHFQVVIADYIGMGMNQISPLIPGVNDQFMELDTYARLIQQIVMKEVDSGAIEKYIITGGSFGSVAATVVGAHLSKMTEAKYQPSLILLSLIVPFQDEFPKPAAATAEPGWQIEWTPRRVKNRMCILPQGPDCFDDHVLQKLKKKKRQQAVNVINQIFSNFNSTNQTAEQRFFRDLFHWEVVQSPTKAAAFLIDIILNDGNLDYPKLRAWFEKSYTNLPWNFRYRTASYMASIESHSCQFGDMEKDFRCACFKNQSPYLAKNYQIADPVPVIYVNGTEDSQTSLAGAVKHFEDQKKKEKRFFKLCGLGHEVFHTPEKIIPGQIDRAELIDQFFAKGIEGIEIELPRCYSPYR